MTRIGLAIFVGGSLAFAGCATKNQRIGLAASDNAPTKHRSDYSEQHRPAYHFSPPTGWMNDPNGLVFQDGEWHMFYQYYPNDTRWGPMHWGHSISSDLVNWHTLPIAIAPGEEGYIFSGSAVIDHKNSAGFGADAMVAIYTIHDPTRAQRETHDHESQGIAYSLDKGRNFQKFISNPVLANPGDAQDFRDPNVFWDDRQNRWKLALAVSDHIRFYESPDLREWNYLSSFGKGIGAQAGVWECPDLFPITDEKTGRTRWVLIQNVNPGGPQGGSGTQYFVGDWDGKQFSLDSVFTAPAWLDQGPDNYAGVTWGQAPNGRRIFIGWMSNWLYAQKVPTGVWRSAMTIPREISLYGMELRQQPVSELESLRVGAGKTDLDALSKLLPTAEYDFTFNLPATGSEFVITFANAAGEKLLVGLDQEGRWFIDRRQSGKSGFHRDFAAIHYANRKHRGASAQFKLLIDKASIEIFTDDGATVMTETFFPSLPFDQAILETRNGAKVGEMRGWQLRRAKFDQ